MIHIFEDEGEFCVWTDCEPGHDHEKSGRIVGSGNTRLKALVEARKELGTDLVMVEAEIQKCTR